MRIWSRRPVEDRGALLADFDEISYSVIVHVPLPDAPPSAETVRLAVSERLGLSPERVEASMSMPWMGG